MVQLSALPGFMDLPEPWLCIHRDQAGCSPLAKESSQLQLGRSERLLGDRGGSTSVRALSLQTSFQGSTGIRISKLLHC